MPIVIGRSFERRSLPENLARVAAQADDLEYVFVIRANAVRMQVLLAIIHVLDGFSSRNDRAFDGGGEKNLVAPNDGRRVSPAGDRSFPFDVLCGAPFHGQVFLGGDALA